MKIVGKLSVLSIVWIGALALIGLTLHGCGEPTPTPKNVEKQVYINEFGQAYDEILVGQWQAWLDAHKDCKIVSITSFCGYSGDSNPTTSILVVYVPPPYVPPYEPKKTRS